MKITLTPKELQELGLLYKPNVELVTTSETISNVESNLVSEELGLKKTELKNYGLTPHSLFDYEEYESCFRSVFVSHNNIRFSLNQAIELFLKNQTE